MLTVSCDFFDLDSIGAESALTMRLNYDTLYVMRGDTIQLMPIFEPDTINITNLYAFSNNDNIVSVQGGKILAVNEGRAKLYFQSISARLLDSCFVYVSRPWEVDEDDYLYETVFYTHVTVEGQPLPDHMTVAAFVGRDCRAIGQLRTYHGITMMQFRVGSNELNTDPNPSWYDEPADPDADTDSDPDSDPIYSDDDASPASEPGGWVEPYREVITFRCYDPRRHRIFYCPQREYFDGETHGTLSHLYPLTF